MNYNYEKSFSPKDMLTYIVKQYKQILIVLIVGMLIGAGFCAATKKAYVSSTERDQLESRIAAMRLQIGDAQADQAESAFKTYTSLMNQKNSIQKFMDDSVYLNLTENNSQKLSLVYLISNSTKANDIATSIKSLLVDESLYNACKKELNQNLSFTQFNSLVNVLVGNDLNNSSSIQVNNGEQQNAANIIIYISDQNKNQVDTIGKYVKQRFSQICNTLKKNYGNFSYSLGDKSYSKVTDSQINGDKNTYTNQLSTVTNAIGLLNNTLSADQQTYFGYLNKLAKVKPGKKVFSVTAFVKFMVLVGAVLTVFYICILIIKYISSSKLHNAKEIENAFNLPILYDGEFDESIISNELQYVKERFKDQSIALTTSNENLDELKRLAKDNNITVFAHKPMKKEEFSQLLSVDRVILLEKNESSDMKKLYDTISYYAQKGKVIEGFIVIK